MCISYRKYTADFKVPSILVSCIDCNKVNADFYQPEIACCSSIAGILVLDKKLHIPEIESYLNQGFRQIVLLAHLKCAALDYILRNAIIDPPLYTIKKYFEQLSEKLDFNYPNPSEFKEKLISLHIAHQLQELSLIPLFQEKLNEGTLEISGILIDDEINTDPEKISPELLTKIYPANFN